MLAVLHVCALCVSHVGVCGVCVREGGGGGQGPLDPPLNKAKIQRNNNKAKLYEERERVGKSTVGLSGL